MTGSQGPVLPGATIGILGGGQLGRMTAMAARALGYGVAVLDPDPRCAAGAVADQVITAAFDDVAAAEALARGSQVVTYEIERIGAAALEAAARIAPLRPGPSVLALVQDRAVQKRWLEAHGFPVGPWAPAASPVEAEAAAARLGGPCRLKAARGGYDGRGQARAKTAAAAREAFPALGGGPVVVERELDLELELSVLVARRPSGEVVLHPPARNWHEDGILDLSVLPGPLPAPAVARASEVARGIAATLGLEGILAAEFFVVAGGGLYVNELAPRPHNTFHTTEAACATSQFEQHVRAVCDLPLGEGTAFRPAALANLLGDLWLGRTPDFSRALAVPEVKLRLYGKEPRPGRKLGHLLATAETAEEALARVREARRILEGGA